MMYCSVNDLNNTLYLTGFFIINGVFYVEFYNFGILCGSLFFKCGAVCTELYFMEGIKGHNSVLLFKLQFKDLYIHIY